MTNDLTVGKRYELDALKRNETRKLDENRKHIIEKFRALSTFDRHDSYDIDRAREALVGAREFVADQNEYGALVADLNRAQRPAADETIALALASLAAAFPNAAKTDLTGYGAALAEDVAAKMPSAFAVVTACIGLRQKCKFLPTISEVLDKIEAQEDRLWWSLRFIEDLPSRIEYVEQAIAEWDKAHAPKLPKPSLKRQGHRKT